jgi:hypothetical protein
VSLSEISLSADTVGIGDLVDLSFVIDMPPGMVAFLPDSLDASNFESFESVRWTSDAAETGGLAVPEFPIFVARSREAVRADFSNDGDLVGSWSAFRAEPSRTPSARLLMIPPQPLWVASVLEIEDASNGIQPRPVADVVGRARHWPATIFVVLFGALLAWAIITSVRAAWISVRDRPAPPPDPRLAALAAFDALIAEGPHRVGDVRRFYTRASDITRRFVEVLDQRWGPAQTSTELMTDLETAAQRQGFTSMPEVDALTGVMEHAEAVKFGGDRPEADAAEREVSEVRSWIEGVQSP